MERKYWNCVDEVEIGEIVDRNVGLALYEYICESSYINMFWAAEAEPIITFTTDDVDFTKSRSLWDVLVEAVGDHRPGGDDATDLFFNPNDDRRTILLQALIRTYVEWKNGGVHSELDENLAENVEGE